MKNWNKLPYIALLIAIASLTIAAYSAYVTFFSMSGYSRDTLPRSHWQVLISDQRGSYNGKDPALARIINDLPELPLWGPKEAGEIATLLNLPHAEARYVTMSEMAGQAVAVRMKCGGPITPTAYKIIRIAMLDRLASKDWLARQSAVVEVAESGMLLDHDVRVAVEDLCRDPDERVARVAFANRSLVRTDREINAGLPETEYEKSIKQFKRQRGY